MGLSSLCVNADLYGRDGGTQVDRPPLVVHLIHRLAMGGLENGVVNLINALPADRYRHAIVSLTDYTDFRYRIRREKVPIFALHKRTGHDLGVYWRFWRLLRMLRPAIVHTRNLPTLEFLVLAALSGVRGRVHGEHGRDIYDLDGSSTKYNLLRKAVRPFVHHYIAVSDDLSRWLTTTIGVPARYVKHIYNGVNVQRFRPRCGERSPIGPTGFCTSTSFAVGTVGRIQTVKDQVTLVRAFLRLLMLFPAVRDRVRLVIIGDGLLREECLRLLRAENAMDLAWLPGERDDIPEIMRSLDLFVLPSLAEGISNTILEAMASGLPVVATHVGGNPELVKEGETGSLVPPTDVEAMAKAIYSYVVNPERSVLCGQAGRKQVERCFSIEAMMSNYLAVYDSVLGDRKNVDSSVAQHADILCSD